MGCDCHIYLEITINNGRKWCADHHHIEETSSGYYYSLSMWRDYELFGRLADVRGYHRKNKSPKGLPQNVSDVVIKAHIYWGQDAHSASYMSLRSFYIVLKDLGYDKEEPGMPYQEPFDYPNNSYTNIQLINIVKYCDILKMQLMMDQVLMGKKVSDIRFRLVYFFDS